MIQAIIMKDISIRMGGFMGQQINWYKEVLKKNGIKNTIQKDAILNVLIKAPSHITVEEIYQQIKDMKIGLATIYRSLKLFEEFNYSSNSLNT